MVYRPCRLGLTRGIAQVVAHLGAQGSLQHRLLELLEDPLKLGWRHRPGDELLKQLG